MTNEKFFPTGNERKKVVEENQKQTVSFQEKGKSMIQDSHYYTDVDSPLEGSMVDTGNSFSFSFHEIIPQGYINMRDYIEKNLAEKKGHAVGIEFGGLGYNLFAGFDRGFFKKSLGVTLVDHRMDSWKQQDEKIAEEKKLDHTVVEGNILSPDLYKNLEKKLDKKKADLVIERMFRGLEFMPQEPYEIGKVLQKWYSMLNENGMMFVQVPVVFNNLLEKWGLMIQKGYGHVIELRYKKGKYDMGRVDDPSVFILKKLKGAPEKLPFLDPRTVQETEKNTDINYYEKRNTEN
ncbi:MAG: hypothetical protein V4665_03965 [Patescibacteria group bacterium]